MVVGEVEAPVVDESGFEFTRVAPNPILRNNHDHVTVYYRSGTDEDLTVRVMDLTGKVLLQEKRSAARGVNSMELSTTQLSVGTYLIEVTTEFGVKTEKLVVQ